MKHQSSLRRERKERKKKFIFPWRNYIFEKNWEHLKWSFTLWKYIWEIIKIKIFTIKGLYYKMFFRIDLKSYENMCFFYKGLFSTNWYRLTLIYINIMTKNRIKSIIFDKFPFPFFPEIRLKTIYKQKACFLYWSDIYLKGVGERERGYKREREIREREREREME